MASVIHKYVISAAVCLYIVVVVEMTKNSSKFRENSSNTNVICQAEGLDNFYVLWYPIKAPGMSGGAKSPKNTAMNPEIAGMAG